MKKIMTLASLMLLSATAFAGFQSGEMNNATAVNSVAQAKKAMDDTPVTLKGKIVRQIDKDEFIFKDSTGEIKIDVEDHAWQGQNITPKNSVILQGKVDKNDFGQSEIDVYSIQKQ